VDHEMWLGIMRRRRLFVAGDVVDLARLLYYDPESEDEALYCLQRHCGAEIDLLRDWRGDHLLINGRQFTFGITIADLEDALA
jgi:hypothetical protein